MKLNTKEDKIKNIAHSLIPQKLKINLLNLLSDICINKRDYEIINTNKELKVYFDKIEKYTGELNSILMMPIDKRNDFCEELKNTSEDIMKTFSSIYMYYRLSMIISDELYEERDFRELKKDKEFKDFKLDTKEVVYACMEFIYDFDDNNDLNDEIIISKRKSEILAFLPLKMTKEKYNDYLKKSFNEMLCGLTKNTIINLIEKYKKLFSPFNHESYGKDFSFIREKLLGLYEMDFLSISDDEIAETIETITDIGVDIENIKEILSSFYNDTNYILNIAMFCVDNEYLFDEDIMLKDVYYSTKSLAEDDKNEAFIEDILDRVYDMIESMENDILSMDKNFNDIFDMIDIEKVSEDVYTYIITKFKIDANFNDELEFVLEKYSDTEEGENVAESEFLNEKIDELIEYIKNSCANISNKSAKRLKKLFFELIMCYIDDDEYEEYIEYVIDGIKDMERGLIYLFNLSGMFEYKKFKDDHSHIHHHNHCDCGHHH